MSALEEELRQAREEIARLKDTVANVEFMRETKFSDEPGPHCRKCGLIISKGE